jgi:Mlc titration factor MtfA (ptsG expression regulator)
VPAALTTLCSGTNQLTEKMIAVLIVIIVVALLIYFVSQKNKKTAEASTASIAPVYRDLLNEHVSYFEKLDEKSKKRFLSMVTQFLRDVRVEGVGTEITDLDKVLIASGAVIPIFGFPDWRYKNLTNVILYPHTFDDNFQFEGEERNIMGMVGSGYMNGQMLLSRDALLKGFSTSAGKGNTAIHEFVHLLDKADGATDGVPENLLAHAYTVPWLKMMHQEMHRIKAGKSDINPYALTSEAEFLAVAAEYFFEKPEEFEHMHPDIYQLLCQAFSQHPANTN